jgi:hypothetical protein
VVEETKGQEEKEESNITGAFEALDILRMGIKTLFQEAKGQVLTELSLMSQFRMLTSMSIHLIHGDGFYHRF